MCIIIGVLHQFIGHCLIPLDPCFLTFYLSGSITAGIAGPETEVPMTGYDFEKASNFTLQIGCDDSKFSVIIVLCNKGH